MISLKLSILLACVSLASIHAEELGCWDRFEDQGYRGMSGAPVKGPVLCRALCFYSASVDGKCGNFDGFPNSCARQTDDKGFEESRIYKLKGLVHYKLKDECKGMGCWTQLDKCYSNLKEIAAADDVECRRLCLETRYCTVAAFDSGKCIIQVTRNLVEGGACQPWKVSSLCKNEILFVSVADKLYPGLADVGKKGELACRIECMKDDKCAVYALKDGSCFVQKGLEAVDECTSEDSPGAMTYYRKDYY